MTTASRPRIGRPASGRAAEVDASQPFARLDLTGKKVLIVASTGGHLAQAVRIAELVSASPESLIVTFESPQSDGLCEERRVAFVPYVKSRDVSGVLRAAVQFRKILRAESFDAVLATGAGVALSALPLSRARRIRSMYVESYSRFDGPSLTGRLMSRLPGVETYTQHEQRQDARWIYAGNVLPADAPPVEPSPSPSPSSRAPRILVTLGTIQVYRFDALVDQVLAALPVGAEVTWQLGCTTRTDLPGRVTDILPEAEFDQAAREADIVVSHAGVGSALEILEMGRPLLLVPRRAARGEHVDDHQVQVCRGLQARGLATYREVEELQPEDLRPRTVVLPHQNEDDHAAVEIG
jgi:UDP-N-acetylglucosamine--N-acetylmuramyl-(pentapeptide) pyrophosphoryl-undecaprenol N-acetylglucosamine transferase